MTNGDLTVGALTVPNKAYHIIMRFLSWETTVRGKQGNDCYQPCSNSSCILRSSYHMLRKWPENCGSPIDWAGVQLSRSSGSKPYFGSCYLLGSNFDHFASACNHVLRIYRWWRSQVDQKLLSFLQQFHFNDARRYATPTHRRNPWISTYTGYFRLCCDVRYSTRKSHTIRMGLWSHLDHSSLLLPLKGRHTHGVLSPSRCRVEAVNAQRIRDYSTPFHLHLNFQHHTRLGSDHPLFFGRVELAIEIPQVLMAFLKSSSTTSPSLFWEYDTINNGGELPRSIDFREVFYIAIGTYIDCSQNLCTLKTAFMKWTALTTKWGSEISIPRTLGKSGVQF